MNRRTFVKSAAGAGLALALPGCSCLGLGGPLVRADLDKNKDKQVAPIGLTREEAAILYHASLAPSGHNAQPWFVRVEEPGRWLIGLDPQRRLAVVDPDDREALLSLGAFTENLVLAAGALGREPRLEILANTPPEKGFIRVELKPGRPSGYSLERLTMRRTVKHGFRPDPLKPEHLKTLSGAVEGWVHYFPPGSPHADCIAQGTTEAFRAQVQRDQAMVESANWTRLSNKEALDLTAKLAREGGGWLILTGPSESPADLIENGRRFQRMALLLREMSLAVQPMTQILEEKTGREMVRANHSGSLGPQFILRVGYLDKYPDPVSLRRPVG